MADNDCLHKNHRERLIKQFLENPQGFPDHLLLEMLLFRSIPRKDTNPTAHLLLRTFGSLEKIFSASASELTVVNGIGKQTAADLVLCGKIFERIYSGRKKPIAKVWKSYGANKFELFDYFDGCSTERLLLLLLDDKKNLLTQIEFDDGGKEIVSSGAQEIANALAIHKPKFAILVHNHPSGNPNPSELDMSTTIKISLLCQVQGVCLLDHIIIAGRNGYSFHVEGKMQSISTSYDLDKILCIEDNKYE